MRSSLFSVRGVTVAAAFTLLAGCSGSAAPAVSSAANGGAKSGSTVRAPQSRLQFTVARNGAASPWLPGMKPLSRHLRPAEPDGKGDKGVVYVGQFSGTPVQEYPRNDKKNAPALCSLPGTAVNGLAVDASGNVWVPSGTGGGKGTTQEYGPNCGAAGITIVSPNGQPADAAFDSKGNIYILNIFGAAGAAGSIDIYDPQGNATGNLSDPTFFELIGIAIDNKGNVFVSNRQANAVANVVEFVGGQMPATQLPGVVLGLPGAPQLDRANNLIISDWNSLTLNVYAPPYSGSPTITPMQGLSLWCPLSHNENRLYCADLGGSLDVYSYPSVKYLYSVTNGLLPSGFASGSAPNPAAPL
jgi:hypothetical protein